MIPELSQIFCRCELIIFPGCCCYDTVSVIDRNVENDGTAADKAVFNVGLSGYAGVYGDLDLFPAIRALHSGGFEHVGRSRVRG